MKLWPTLRREGSELDMKDVSTQPEISSFWDTLWGSMATTPGYTPRLVDRVWVANRCTQLVSDAISSMPLRFTGTREPAWVTNPDPNWYPNGIRSALFAAVWDMYVIGDTFLYVTDQYADGFPSGWTVLNASTVTVGVDRGRKTYRDQQVPLDADRVVQISRDTRSDRLRGTAALSAFGGALWGALAVGELSRTMAGGSGIPNAVLKSHRKLTSAQAQAIQDGWVAARARSPIGAPAVLDDAMELEQLAFSPTDMLLTDLQQYYGRVIASAFGVPPFLVNLPLEGGLTYQNPQMLIEQWWRGELRPRAEQIAAALSAQMLPRGSAVEFDSREALAPAWQELVSGSLDMVAAGVLTVNEFRAGVLHLPPLEEGDALDELTQPTAAQATPATQTPVVLELRPTGTEVIS